MHKVLLVAALVPCACSMAPAQTGPAGPPAAICRNEGLQRFVGQQASSEVGAQMLAASGARVIRWVAPGMAVTMDYREDRLTVRLTADNRIMTASCG